MENILPQNKKIIVNVIGINDENRVVVKHNGGSINRLDLTITGNSTLLDQVTLPEFKILTLILGGADTRISLNFPKDAIWLNSISNADANTKSLKMLIGILDANPFDIINPPDKVLCTTRDQTAHLLSGIEGVSVPECFRFAPEGISDIKNFLSEHDLSFPFLFRPIVDHGKQSLIRIDTYEEISRLERFAFDGEREYYLTKFVDFASHDGLYRKMRFLVIGERVIPRHLMISSSWQIHGDKSDKSKPLLREEEIAFLSETEPSIVRRCLEIQKRFGLDYIGIDCAIDREGDLLVFEANAHSMIGIGKNDPRHRQILGDIDKAFQDLVYSKV